MRIKRLTEDNPVARALAWMAGLVLRYRRLCVFSQVVLFAASILITLKYPGLDFDMRQDNLVGANKSYHQTFLRFKKEFPTQDDLAVVVESDNPVKNRQFVERLGAKVELETNIFHNTFYKGDFKMLGSKALLFAEEDDLKEMGKLIEGYRPFISRFTHTTNLVSLFDMVSTQIRTARQEQNADNESLVKALPALERIVNEATYSLRRPGTPPSPGVTALFSPDADAEQHIYITFNNGAIYLLTTQAPTEDQNEAAVTRMRELIEETKAEVPGVNVGLTGEPVLDVDQMNQSQKDATAASIISLIVCAFIFIYGYQQTGRPIKATICLIVGLGYTLAFATLTVGHLNILTVTFVPILIGLAIDYGVHLISRYEEELRHGKSEEAALTKAMVYTGQGIFTGAFTTAGAFLAMMFTNFKGIQEMGIICGGGLLICFVPMMTMLPVLLLRGRQNVIDHEAAHAEEARRARIENIWLQRPLWVGGLVVALCVLAATQVHKVYFDYNLLNLQSDGLPAVQFFEKLIYATNAAPKLEGTNALAALQTTNLVAQTTGTNSAASGGDASNKSLLYAAVIATNLQEAALLEQQLTNLPAVAGVESMTKFLAEDQRQKLKLVGDVKRTLSGIQFAEPDRQPVDLSELSFSLYRLNGWLELLSGLLRQEEPELVKQFDALHDAVAELRKQLLQGNLQTNAAKLAEFQQALFDDVRGTFQALQEQDDRAPLRVQDLPESLHNRFVGVTGKYLIMVYPKKDVWDRKNQEELIKQIEPIYKDVTGTPVQLYHYTELLKASYLQAGEYALIAIALLVLVHFRSLAAVVLALIPVGIGSLWLGGLMGHYGVPLNPANIMTLPLLIGIGVTNGIHILNRFAEEQTPSILSRSTGKAVLVSGLTTIAGFGSLALGQHRGLQSLGYVMATGLATCMIAALMFVPALLNLFSRSKPPVKGQAAPSEPCPVEAAK